MMRLIVGALAGLMAAAVSYPSVAASLGPPNGFYSFGYLNLGGQNGGGCTASTSTGSIATGLGSPQSPVYFTTAQLASNGAGAVKFWIAQPFFYELLTDSADNLGFYGGYAIMTFTGTTAGTIHFQAGRIFAVSGTTMPGFTMHFSDYVQVVKSGAPVTFSFTLEMPGCNTDVAGQFQE